MENSTAHPVENMLTDHQLQKSLRRRAKILVPTMIVANLIGLAYIPLAASFMNPLPSPGVVAILVFGVIPLILIPMAIADQFAKRHTLHCPKCGKELIRRLGLLRFTRSCPFCSRQIIVGKARSVQAFRRYAKWSNHRHNQRELRYTVWIFPLIGALLLLAVLTNSELSSENATISWLSPASAVALSFLLWWTTGDRYLVIPIRLSLILVILSLLLDYFRAAFH